MATPDVLKREEDFFLTPPLINPTNGTLLSLHFEFFGRFLARMEKNNASKLKALAFG